MLGRAPSPTPQTGRKVDRYDLTTARFHDVHTVADGPYVFRQHGYTATTLGGRDYANFYGFLFRFDDDGLIDRVWEHWGTLAAYEQLFQSDLVVHDPDELLMTTPSVRLRLDLERPVERDVIERCLDVAVHAPNGSNTQPYRFVCVDDPERKLAIADLYRDAMRSSSAARAPTRRRTTSTAPPRSSSASPAACSTCATTCTRSRCCASRSSPAAPTASAPARRPNAPECSGRRAAGAR